jgi:hypothetical protein
MAQRSRAASRRSSAETVGIIESLAANTGGDLKPVDAAGGQSNRIITQTNPDGFRGYGGFPAVGKTRWPGRWRSDGPDGSATNCLSPRVDSQMIARRVPKVLPNAQVKFGGYDRGVAQ